MVNFGPGDDLELGTDSSDFGMVDGIDHTVMKIRQVFRAFQGEWWLEPTLGIPYHQSILGQKQPDLQAIRGIYVAALSSVPGVASITSLDVSFDNASRTYSVTFSAVHDSGATIEEGIIL